MKCGLWADEMSIVAQCFGSISGFYDVSITLFVIFADRFNFDPELENTFLASAFKYLFYSFAYSEFPF